jgi:hypothetical protein
MATSRIHPHRDDDDIDMHHSGLERLGRLEGPDETPHGCYDGRVFIGHLVEEDGEEVEAFEAIVCRRCQESA